MLGVLRCVEAGQVGRGCGGFNRAGRPGRPTSRRAGTTTPRSPTLRLQPYGNLRRAATLWPSRSMAQEDLDHPMHRVGDSRQQLVYVAAHGPHPIRCPLPPSGPVRDRLTTRFERPSGHIDRPIPGAGRGWRRRAGGQHRGRVGTGFVQEGLESGFRQERSARRQEGRESGFGRGVEAEVTVR